LHAELPGENAYNAKNSVSLSTILDRVIDDIVLLGRLLPTGLLHVGDALLDIVHINLGQALVEEDLCRIELELEAELFVVTALPSASGSAEARSQTYMDSLPRR
jgi:hypothetical protein